jgi:hypothetical protein
MLGAPKFVNVPVAASSVYFPATRILFSGDNNGSFAKQQRFGLSWKNENNILCVV